MVRIFGILPYPYDIVGQAFFCPVVLNPGRNTKQDLAKTGQKIMLQCSCGTDFALAQIIAPLGGDVNRLPCLLLPSGRRQTKKKRQKKEDKKDKKQSAHFSLPDKPSKGFVTRFFPTRRTLVEAQSKSAWAAIHCSFRLRSTGLAKPVVTQVVWYSCNNNLSPRNFGFITSLFSLVGANSLLP